MCFSAMSSFAGGAVLASIGTATSLSNRDPSRRLFAAIPLVFGIQQFAEGVVWLTLPTAGHEPIRKAATTLFLIAAVVLWPTLVPLSVLLMERTRKRRAWILAFLGVGVAVSLAHAVGMLLFPVTARILGFHIQYAMASPLPVAMVTMAGYLVATIAPLFASSVARVRVFGVIIALSYAATQVFYREYLVSVWCFFAAIASGVIWWILRERRPVVSPDASPVS